MCWHGLCHGNDGIQEDLHLPVRKPGVHPMLGPPADGFVLQGERHAQQQRSPPLPYRPNDGGGCACWTPHGGDHGIGVQHQSHITDDIISATMSSTVLVRTELDALPVEEMTGAPFASRVRGKNAAGQDVGVMHACGHDLHMMSLLGTAQALAKWKDRWSGTLMLVGQPSEETVEGARAMLADGFYTRFPKPDYALALHNEPTLEAGEVGLVLGPVYASATTIEVRIRGVGGHGAHPESTKDPVVMAAQCVLALQTIVSRQTLPLEPGGGHGGLHPRRIEEQYHSL